MMNKWFQNHQPENSKDWRIMNRLSKELCRTGLIKVPFFLEEDFIKPLRVTDFRQVKNIKRTDTNSKNRNRKPN